MTIKKLSDVFEAYPKSTADFMRERGQCFYIPAYQRPFSWGRENIERLVDDIVHGLDQLLQRNDATAFIGTLITIHDTDYTTIDPLVRAQVPSKVMTVIDGQQRLTTLLLLNMVLHDELTNRHLRFDKPNDDASKWLFQQCLQTLSELRDTLEEDMSHGDGDYRWYPRMTRAYLDKWSRLDNEAQYESDIADLLHQYGRHCRSDSSGTFRPTGERPLGRSYELVRRTIRRAIALGTHSDIDFPEVALFGDAGYLALTLFNDELPPAVVDALNDSANGRYAELFRLLGFARFALHRVAVTVVTTRSEDYAFDMFESLNTTGEPLTAFETFRPRVIREEGHSEYQGSPAHGHLSKVETYLEQFENAQNRLSATSNLLIPFALAESGYKLSKRLSDQRRYLRSTYDNSGTEERDVFLQNMSHTAQLLEGAWDKSTWSPSGPSLIGLEPLDTEEKLCFDVLQSTNHRIAIGVLTRFYSAQRHDQDVNIGTVLRAVTAFLAIWRGAKGGTSGIDAAHRDLLAKGRPETGIPALARLIADEDALDVETLCSYFRLALRDEGLDSRDAWVAAASNVAIYHHNKDLARLLLLAATHDTTVDPTQPGLIKRARPGVLPLLNYEKWMDSGSVTVEHVAPQNPGDGSTWSTSIYRDTGMKDCLGNLLLLPTRANSLISNRPWQEKRMMYRILAARNREEIETARQEMKDAGLDIAMEVLVDNDYLPIVAGVAAYNEEWNADIISQRSALLCGLAWDRLSPWLNIAP
ncbi:DUF262 domain-containing protein [Candidatus Poriferisodalis sp.]|uniref:DUF262 domain-containing protein n=1 Tax=Candidatus Poriferisodalis sp. TaxID=3101277 RepID=UPI003B010842